MPKLTIDSPAEYALYACAKQIPFYFEEAERFVGSMLVEDQNAARRVKALIAKQESSRRDADAC